jgi:hypothetical protein
MTRTSEAALLDFCAQQHGAFDLGSWLKIGWSDRDDLVVTAFLLASARWYGHREELLAVVQRLHPQGTAAFPALIATRDFDCGRFSGMLRTRIAP